jgi:peptidoglycan hydrolase CwlO-like protein
MNKLKQTIIIGLILALLPAGFGFAESGTVSATQQDKDSQKAELQRQLEAIQKEILQYEQQLSGVQSEKKTLNNRLKQLQAERNKVTLQIQATSLNIDNLNSEIEETENEIKEAMDYIVELRGQIAGLLPEIYDKDQRSTVEMLLANNGLIGFYTELDAYEQINKNLGELLQKIDEESHELKLEQDQLMDQEEQQNQLLSIQSLQNQALSTNISSQNTLISETKGKEDVFQNQLKDKRAQAATIQGRMYELFGVSPGTKQVTFGEAVQIAKHASSLTGVRAAFLLAILTQESNLGKNVGTCNRAGDPPNKSYKVIMKPDRDVKPFEQVTGDLGMDPNTTPVSCPMRDKNGNQIGWGGAMGPAQFIPSTWMGYKDKVAAITGKTANPWDINDAFLASGIKLKAGGAGTVAGEWAAAMIYFSGSTNPRFRFYGDNVVALANRYQADIEAIQ